MNARPPWLKRGADALLNQTHYRVGEVDERGLVLETLRRGFSPVRRRLNPQEFAAALDSGALRPFRA